MLSNVKSSYFLKITFSYLNIKRKLKLVKYNKFLKNLIDLSLIKYKIFSERYIIYEEKGKGKEYDNEDYLIFEGEYLNGKKNGKAKEYDKNGI